MVPPDHPAGRRLAGHGHHPERHLLRSSTWTTRRPEHRGCPRHPQHHRRAARRLRRDPGADGDLRRHRAREDRRRERQPLGRARAAGRRARCSSTWARLKPIVVPDEHPHRRRRREAGRALTGRALTVPLDGPRPRGPGRRSGGARPRCRGPRASSTALVEVRRRAAPPAGRGAKAPSASRWSRCEGAQRLSLETR